MERKDIYDINTNQAHQRFVPGAFMLEGSVDNITAYAGGGQSNAVLLTGQTSRITTVATAGDSVMLPPSQAGLEMLVINHGANPAQVYGNGSDKIDDVAAATGVSQMANSAVIYICATGGNWYTDGLATGFYGGLQTFSYANGLTATGSNQAGALALSAMINRVTNAAASTGVALPVAAPGYEIIVIHNGANPLQVYGNGSDTINGVAGATGIQQIPNSALTFFSTVAGAWQCEGVGGGYSGQFPTVSTTNNITAHAGGGQGSAVLLTTVINRITTVATAADSCVLPASAAGMEMAVANAAATNSMNLFPASGEQINALGANTAFAIAAGKTASLYCTNAGQWHAVLSA